MLVLIDNGHGRDTKGKCSPDGTLREWAWTREVAVMIYKALSARGVEVAMVTPESEDVPLKMRCARVNDYCRRRGKENVVLVSVHINAAGGDGQWHVATGFSSWVARRSSESSKRLAQLLYGEAEKRELQGNRAVPSCRYWQSDFYILKHSACPAVLTENLFMDNRGECEFLKTAKAKELIAGLHVDAIISYINGGK